MDAIREIASPGSNDDDDNNIIIVMMVASSFRAMSALCSILSRMSAKTHVKEGVMPELPNNILQYYCYALS